MELSETSDLMELELESEDKDVVEVISEDSQIEEIVKALSSETRRKILRYIRDGPKDVSSIAEALSMTEANISAQIKKLENAQLISCSYSSGNHGVRKVSKLKYPQLTIRF